MKRTLVTVALLGLVAVTGCGGRREATEQREVVYVAPRNGDATRMNAKELAQHSGMSAAAAVAAAGRPETREGNRIVSVQMGNGGVRVERAESRTNPEVPPMPPVPPIAPVPPIPPVDPVFAISSSSPTKIEPKEPKIAFTVRSQKPWKTKGEAEADALLMAKFELEYALKKLDQPVKASPTLPTIRAEYMKSSELVKPTEEDVKTATGPENKYVDIRIELTEEQVTKLRVGQRVNGGLYIAGLLAAVIAAVYGFLRVDAWSKGYLTLWLVAAMAFVIAAAAFLGLKG